MILSSVHFIQHPNLLNTLSQLTEIQYSHIYIGSILTPFHIVCVEVLQPSQPNGVMLSMVSLPNYTFTGKI